MSREIVLSSDLRLGSLRRKYIVSFGILQRGISQKQWSKVHQTNMWKLHLHFTRVLNLMEMCLDGEDTWGIPKQEAGDVPWRLKCRNERNSLVSWRCIIYCPCLRNLKSSTRMRKNMNLWYLTDVRWSVKKMSACCGGGDDSTFICDRRLVRAFPSGPL